MKKTIIAFSIIFPSLAPITASAQMMGWGNSWNMGGFMGAGWIFGLIFWILIIVGVVWLVKHLVGGCSSTWHEKKEDLAVEILKQRYVKGEIKKEEFEEKMKDISK